MAAINYASVFMSGKKLKRLAKPYLQHIKSSEDLETTYEAIRAGFVALALEKNRRATPFVAEARALKVAATKAKSPSELMKIEGIQAALLTAAGVSDKATAYLEESDKCEAVKGLIKKFLEPAGNNFVEELVFRFLLTRGDTLGGSMRNVGGFIAQKKLTRAIIACLKVAGKKCRWLHSETKEWSDIPADDADIELYLRGISWQTSNENRTLVYNRKVPFLGKKGKNVDLCLFNCEETDFAKVAGTPSSYIALGELKGGIDPAGADEHWKTAYTALSRIHKAFFTRKLKPHTFFIGAAIEAEMAVEIWDMLESGEFENAANLTDDDQIVSLTNWLCGL
jgi:hypothetical protein